MAKVQQSNEEHEMHEMHEGHGRGHVHGHGHGGKCVSQNEMDYMETGSPPPFVIESKGTWIHASFHLMCALAAPSLLSLPYAIAGLGWGPGVLALCFLTSVSFYCYYMLSLVLEKMEEKGVRCLRFRDLAHHIIGLKWSLYIVAPGQFTICFLAIVGYILLGGQTMKGIYLAVDGRGHIALHYFTTIFGAFTMMLAQIPSVHSMRHFTLISALMCLGYTICAVAGSIIAGDSERERDYGVTGGPIHKVFSAFGCMSMMAETYGNPILVEIQATLASPIKGKMLKSLSASYFVAIVTFFSVAICGYWAFGHSVDGIIFGSIGESWAHYHVVPRWIYIAGSTCILLQVLVVTVLFSQPTFEVLEGITANIKHGKYSVRNFVPRLIGRSMFVLVATILANLLPFFPDIIAINGSLGYIPLCILLPLLFYNKTCSNYNTRVGRIHYWVNTTLMVVFSCISIIGCSSAVRQIIIDSKSQ